MKLETKYQINKKSFMRKTETNFYRKKKIDTKFIQNYMDPMLNYKTEYKNGRKFQSNWLRKQLKVL